MKKQKRMLGFAVILILFCIIFLVQTNLANASTVFVTWPTQQTSDPNKKWTVNFNMPLKKVTVTADTVYVLTSDGTKVDTSLELLSDDTSVAVIPRHSYDRGKYELFIDSGIQSVTGTYLVKPVIVPFTVTSPDEPPAQGSTSPVSYQGKIVGSPGGYILVVQANAGPYLSNVTVSVSSEVYKVLVNSTVLNYRGQNVFSGGIFGISPGETVSVKVYNNKGSLLQTYQCVLYG